MRYEDMFEKNQVPRHWYAKDPDGCDVVKVLTPQMRATKNSVIVVKDEGVWRPIQWSRKSAVHLRQPAGSGRQAVQVALGQNKAKHLEYAVLDVELRGQV